MLSKNQKLPRELFEPVSKTGRRLATSLFSFQYSPSSADCRFSAVVSKKVSKTAVGRNRIRRRVYDTLRKLIPQMKNPSYAIFHAKPPVMNATLAETEREIAELLQKAGILE